MGQQLCLCSRKVCQRDQLVWDIVEQFSKVSSGQSAEDCRDIEDASDERETESSPNREGFMLPMGCKGLRPFLDLNTKDRYQYDKLSKSKSLPISGELRDSSS